MLRAETGSALHRVGSSSPQGRWFVGESTRVPGYVDAPDLCGLPSEGGPQGSEAAPVSRAAHARMRNAPHMRKHGETQPRDRDQQATTSPLCVAIGCRTTLVATRLARPAARLRRLRYFWRRAQEIYCLRPALCATTVRGGDGRPRGDGEVETWTVVNRFSRSSDRILASSPWTSRVDSTSVRYVASARTPAASTRSTRRIRLVVAIWRMR